MKSLLVVLATLVLSQPAFDEASSSPRISEMPLIYKMGYLLRFSFWVLCVVVVLSSFSWASHSVGEPKLEEDPSWKNCCADQDCVPQPVRIIGKEHAGQISVQIEGVKTKVTKDKLHAVPSQRTWVCYFDRNGAIANENIRCILYPEKASTVKIHRWLRTLLTLW